MVFILCIQFLLLLDEFYGDNEGDEFLGISNDELSVGMKSI